MSSARAKALMAEMNKLLGAGTVQTASDDQYKVEHWPSGLLPIDILLQGGFPKGRFVEIFGNYSTLKSYIGLCTIAQVQASGGTAAVIDTEHSFDSSWAEAIGIKTDELIIARPKSGELGIDIAETLIRGETDFIMFDSIAAALPQDERKKRLDDNNLAVARLAALMSAACRRLTAANKKTSILWINQTRVNVGVLFGSNETTPGGKAIPYYASYRLRMQMIEALKRDIEVFDGDKKRKAKEQYAQKFKAEVVKSKLSAPFRDVFFNWDLEGGRIDIPTYLMAQGLEDGIVTMSGTSAWNYDGTTIRGKDKFREHLATNPDVLLKLENRIRREHDLPEIAVSSAAIGIGNAPKPSSALANVPARKTTLKLKSGLTKGK